MNFKKTLSGAALALGLCLSLMLPAAGAQERTIPEPDLSGLTDEGRALLTQALAYFETSKPGLSGRDLGIAYGRLGLHLMAQGQFESGFAALNHARELDTENFRWPYFMGLTQSAAGNAKGAAALFNDAFRLQPDNTVVATRLGLTLIDAGNADSATTLLDAVVKDATTRNAAAVAGLGRIALERGDLSTAVSRYKAALVLDPNATQLYSVLANAYRAMGDEDAAAQAEGKAGDGLPGFDDPLVALLEAHRQPSSFFIARGDQARDAGRVGQAAVFYDFAAAVNPQDPLAAGRLAALRSGSAASAAAASAPSAPETASDFFERGVFFAAQGDDTKAVGDFEASLERNGDNVAARVFLANAMMRQKRFADAGAQYGIASARDEKNTELRYRQGIAWMAAGRCERAEAALLAGYELDQTQLRVVQAIARLYATCPVDDAKRQTALKYAQALYNGRPTLETSETLAMVFAANGRYEDAADFQRQAIFEALKAGRPVEGSTLSKNLERYVAGQACEEAWPLDHPIFRPAPPSANADPAG
ncbi:MAG: tetratricopeptide repeat protein [Pseudomonadota bacterium]